MSLFKHDYGPGYYNQFLTREKPNSQRNHNRLNTLLAQKPSGRLLEVGCGKAGFLQMAESHFTVTGIDISRAAIDAIRPHFGERVSLLNIEQRPLPGGDYDVIAAFNVLEHLRQPHKVIDKLYRALSPGGILFGSVPNKFGPAGELHTFLSNFFDRTHVSTFTPQTWERIFHHAGFNEVTFFGEVNFGPNRSRYLRGKSWRYLSFNLMFICTKPSTVR
jgi:2-polyprenyl-3-methyl-5-hydroxy-6-metoxy-1,4-benzoquinol methylase